MLQGVYIPEPRWVTQLKYYVENTEDILVLLTKVQDLYCEAHNDMFYKRPDDQRTRCDIQRFNLEYKTMLGELLYNKGMEDKLSLCSGMGFFPEN